MELAESIRKHGFRKWYERQLVEGHAWLVSCFLGIILLATSLETVGSRGMIARTFLTFALAAAGWVLGWFAWRRYCRIMTVAERLGAGATCPKCRAYGAFSVLAAGPDRPQPGRKDIDPDAIWLKVSCRKCRNEWTI
ncbi:MAG: hypothetical protein Fur0039_03660 [Rhodocyclaceae bacterium]